ncbi:MAG TPA: LamG-like jellyroll fold domain-containing protein [Chthoniobacteraceae bacterium]|nr:LamG-like jellyroll fold domain-containing protein [Chthoniobacteraceae bacterium]
MKILPLAPLVAFAGKYSALAILTLGLLNPSAHGAILSPTEVNGLQLWLDAREGVNVTGANRVTQWNDQSGGTTYHAAPPATEQQPLYLPSGTPSIRFDGSRQLRAAGAQGAMQNEMTAFVVVSLKELGRNQMFLDDKGGTSNNDGFYLGIRESNKVEFRVIDSTFPSSGPGAFLNHSLSLPTGYTEGYLVIVARVSSDGTTTLRVGDQETTNPGTLSLENIKGSGEFLSIGSNSGGSWGLDGQIASVLIYDTALSNHDVGEVYDYLYSVHVIPEPQTAILTGAGFLFAVVAGSRRRRARF